jgi:hypothetical protein
MQEANKKLVFQVEKKCNDNMKTMLKTLTNTVEHVGFVDPMKKVYELTNPMKYMSEFFCTMTLSLINDHFVFASKLATLTRKSKESAAIDGPHFIVGLLTVFKQFHPENYKRYLKLISHYYKNVIYETT